MWLHEYFRQFEAGLVSNSRNKLHQTTYKYYFWPQETRTRVWFLFVMSGHNGKNENLLLRDRMPLYVFPGMQEGHQSDYLATLGHILRIWRDLCHFRVICGICDWDLCDLWYLW